MYLIGGSLGLAVFFALPVMLGWENAFCTDKAKTLHPESAFCTIQGAFTQYLAISMALWFFCYTLNLYLTLVKNRRDLILQNKRTHIIQSVICWFSPLLFVIASLAVDDETKHYKWARSDFYACSPANENVYYYGFVLPVQLACGCGTTLLFLVINYVRYNRESTAGMKLIAQASKLSGVSSVEKRLTCLAFTYIIIVFYEFTQVSYFLWAKEPLEHHAKQFLSCKQIQKECPEDYLEYSSPGVTIVASLIIGALCLASFLLLFGTAAQMRLWKYWIAKLAIICHWPNAKEKWSKWGVMPERHRSFVGGQSKSINNGKFPNRFVDSQETLDRHSIDIGLHDVAGDVAGTEGVDSSDKIAENNQTVIVFALAQETAC